MEQSFIASELVVGSLDCPYQTLATIMINAPGTCFREEWKIFSRTIGLPEDFIARWEKIVRDERIEEVVIDILKNWSNNEVVTLGQLSKNLRKVPLVSTADALERHFNDFFASKQSDVYQNELRSQTLGLEQNKIVDFNKSLSPTTPLLETSKESEILDQTGQHDKKDINDNNGAQTRIQKITKFLKSKTCRICFSGGLFGMLGLSMLLFLVIFRQDLLKCTLGMCISDKDPTLPCKEIMTNISVKSQTEYEHVIGNFDKIGCICVHIVNLNPSDWPEKSQLSHSTYIKVLTISNVTSVNTLFDVLSQTIFLRKLDINGLASSYCTYSETRSRFKKKIPYSFLGTVKLSNFSSCAPVYHLLSNLFSFQQLRTISVENSIIDNKNINFIRAFLYNTASTLRTIKLTGEIRSDKFLFHYSKPLIQVRTIQLDIKQRKVLLVPFDSHEIAGENFCRVFVNIHTFVNTVGIDFLDFINVLKCTQLQFITARVIIHAKDPFLNINSAFKGKELENVTLSLQFDTPCPSCEEIDLLGMEEFKRRVRKKKTITFRNCACHDKNDETSSNERDSFVLEHNVNKE